MNIIVNEINDKVCTIYWTSEVRGGIGHIIPTIYNNQQQNNYAVSICQRVSQWQYNLTPSCQIIVSDIH